jgi:peptidyl-prolyl cis-trans isomerase SurA
LKFLRIKDKLREFKTRVTNGESFATLAVLYSEDPGSATKGGELGFVGRGDLVPEFSAVAFNLEPGEVSKIVKTDYGYHIIQLIEKKGERINCRHILLKPQISPAEKIKAIQRLDSIRTAVINKEYNFKEACWKYSR